MADFETGISRSLAARMRGILFASVGGSTLVSLLLMSNEVPHPGRVAMVAALGFLAGALMLSRFGSARAIAALSPHLGGLLVAVGMTGLTPERGTLGLVYLTWLAIYTGFLERPLVAALAAAWLTACYVAAADLSYGHFQLADAIVAANAIGTSTAVTAYLAFDRRRSHVTLDTARRDAEELSLRDPLTGLANRRAFDAEAQLRAIEARLGGILMIDIDHFKNVNDEFGHDAGDAVLKEVARRLGTAIRRADVAARLGGDEFAVLLEGPLTVEGLRRVADAVRGATSAFAAQTSAGQVRVTTSIGGALTAPGAAPEQQARSARSRADNALYQAKKAGRDRAILDGETRAPSARRGRNRPRSGPRAA